MSVTASSSSSTIVLPQLDAIDSFVTAGLLNAKDLASQKGSTAAAKEPLSLQTTSANFKRFVQKSGPIFAAQDAAEAIIRWEDAPRTLFFGAVWAFLCLYPRFVIILPNIIILTILLSTYSPAGDSPYSDDYSKTPSAPPVEGSVDYLANLRNIQILMGHVADIADLGRSLVPYLAWSDEATSLVLLQLTFVSSLFLIFVSPYIPWRYVSLVSGEALLFSGHPISQSFARQATPYLSSLSQRLSIKMKRLMKDDALSDEDLDREIITVEKVEIQRLQDGVYVAETWLGDELPRGHAWIMGENVWEIDVLNEPAIDQDGWVYISIDGRRTATGAATGDRPAAQSRRRRWIRRAVKVAPELN